MHITLTITDPSPEFIAGLLLTNDMFNKVSGKPEHKTEDKYDDTPPPDDVDESEDSHYSRSPLRTRDSLEYLSNLVSGSSTIYASWQGAKFSFRGIVMEVDPYATDDDWVIRIKRGDTDKVVRLTYDDLQTGTLLLV